MKRSNGRGTFVGLILLVLLFIARPGCDPQTPVTVQDYYPPADAADSGNRQVQPVGNSSTAPSTIIIGSFNIRDFGPTKAGRSAVMSTLVDIARRFDLLAIQEISNSDQTVIRQYLDQINSDGSRYNCLIGERQGSSHAKEQYAYLYDSSKFRSTTNHYNAADPRKDMSRPPLVASFECTQAPPGQGFTFTLMNVHVAPREVDREFDALQSIVANVVANHPNEDDFIVLGDFNDSADGMRSFSWLNNQMPLVRPTWATKVSSGRSIDNIVINSFNTNEFRNQSGVLNVAHEYGLNKEDAGRVSDHYPVWAVFSTHEMPSRIANQNGSDRSASR